MSYKIQKSLIKKAWQEIGEKYTDPADPLFNRLLTAAGLEGLAQNRERIEWFQPPPSKTVLKVREGSVLLSFDPEAELTITPDVPRDALEKASQRLDSHPDLRKPLQLLALAALSGNIDWTDDPPFSRQ